MQTMRMPAQQHEKDGTEMAKHTKIAMFFVRAHMYAQWDLVELA
jgi:hypothetical protein